MLFMIPAISFLLTCIVHVHVRGTCKARVCLGSPSHCEGGRVGSVVTRRAIDLKVRDSSPAHGGSRIAG